MILPAHTNYPLHPATSFPLPLTTRPLSHATMQRLSQLLRFLPRVATQFLSSNLLAGSFELASPSLGALSRFFILRPRQATALTHSPLPSATPPVVSFCPVGLGVFRCQDVCHYCDRLATRSRWTAFFWNGMVVARMPSGPGQLTPSLRQHSFFPSPKRRRRANPFTFLLAPFSSRLLIPTSRLDVEHGPPYVPAPPLI